MTGNEGQSFKKPHTCCFCQKVYTVRSALRRHLQENHFKAKKLYCEGLDLKSVKKIVSDENKPSRMERLLMTGNDGQTWNQPHTCCLCQKIFSVRAALRVHLEKNHFKVKKLYCDLCPKIYFSKGCIARHMKAAHERKKYVCKICKYRTATKSHFTRHNLLHTTKAKCPVCNEQVTSLKSHMEGHVPKESCPICRKMISQRTLLRHIETHKRVKIMTQKCGVNKCKKRFDSTQGMKTSVATKNFESNC